MKRIAGIFIIILLTVLISGCTTPPDKNIQLYTVTLTSTDVKTVTTPYFTTVTVTRKETTVVTESFIDVITDVQTVSNITTYTSTVVISSSGNITVTKTFTVYMNALGDGKPNIITFFVYYPTSKITYTISNTITLTYTPYIELYPGSTVYRSSLSIIIAPNNNTTTVYWPAASGTRPQITKFVRGIFSWWDYLYIQNLSSRFPKETDPFKLYLTMKNDYTYATERALSYNEFYLPHEFITIKSGNDGDFAEFYAAMMYARGNVATIALVNYSTLMNFVLVYSGKIINANIMYFDNLQALANVYNIDPTITYIEVGTFRPIRTIYTTEITHQSIMFLNYIPRKLDITAVETVVISDSFTKVIQYAGSVSANHFDFIQIIDYGTTRSTVSFVGNTNIITRWYWGASTLYTVTGDTYVFAGGKIVMLPTPMSPIFGVVFDNKLVTYAYIHNHTTIVRGINVNGNIITTFGRTKSMSIEYYTYKVIDTRHCSTIVDATGTIYYSP